VISFTNDRAYRRGLVLGWTLAEVFLLIVFALLFAFAALMLAQKRRSLDISSLLGENLKLKQSLLEERRKTAVLERENKFFQAHLSDPYRTKDILKELWLAKNEIEQLRAERDRLAREHKLLDDMTTALSRTGPGASPTDKLRGLIEKASAADKINDALAHEHLTPGKAASLADRNNELEKQAATYKAQLADVEAKLTKLGNGADFPPCWPLPGTTRSDYIFDIKLTSTGIIVHNNKLPNRAEDENKLPLGEIQFDSEIGDDDFQQETMPLFELSEKNQCRFYVRVSDQTADDEKDIYKRRLRTVQGRFYEKEVSASAEESAPAADAAEDRDQ